MHERLYYNNYGLRIDDLEYASGDLIPTSRVWVDGEVTDDLIDGTCAIDATLSLAKIRSLIKTYPGKHIYIVKGDISSDICNDEGEIILKDCRVVRQINNIKGLKK